jgi:ribonuclease D
MVSTAGAFAACIETLRNARTLAVDTEGDSLHSYWPRVCLVQITADGVDYIIDPFAIDTGPLAGPFADPAVEVIMHAAENDVRQLKRDFGFSFVNLFDTMVAARILGYPRWGLADLLRDAFGVELDKRFQRHDWAARPIVPAALTYAALDTHYLLALREKLGEELRVAGRADEAAEEFARLAAAPPADHGFDAHDFWRVRGAHDLDPAQRPLLRELYQVRDSEAQRSNRPPFKIMPDSALIAITRAAPHSQQELEAVPGVPLVIARRYGRLLLAAMRRADGQPPLIQERLPRDEVRENRYEALRAWRNARAAARGVEGDVIVANSVLRALAAAAPRDVATLAASGLLGAWKLNAYGAEIVNVLRPLP